MPGHRSGEHTKRLCQPAETKALQSRAVDFLQRRGHYALATQSALGAATRPFRFSSGTPAGRPGGASGESFTHELASGALVVAVQVLLYASSRRLDSHPAWASIGRRTMEGVR